MSSKPRHRWLKLKVGKVFELVGERGWIWVGLPGGTPTHLRRPDGRMYKTNLRRGFCEMIRDEAREAKE
ncbi:MAG TPA: hypothetical protein VGH19_06465 [Verrucomicrobiae bacterium]